MEKFALDKIKKILIVKMSSIGDVIHALPTLVALRKHFPTAHLSWIVEPKSYDLLKNHPDLDEVILLNLPQITKKLKKPATLAAGIREIQQVARQLRKEKYDLVIDLQGLLKSGLVSYFTQSPIRLVYCINREGSSLFATHVVPARKDSPHIIQKYLDTVRFLGLPVTREDEYQFNFALSPEEEEFADKLLASLGIEAGQTVIGINPGTAWPTKTWSAQSFATLGDLLKEKHNCQVLFCGGPGEKDLVQSIMGQMKNQAFSTAGKTNLAQLGALIKKCKVFVGGDTGPLHIAVAVGTPAVALFGPTDPNYSRPLGPRDLVVNKPFDCSPCFKVKKCPKHPNVKCMEAIKPEDVLAAIEKLL